MREFVTPIAGIMLLILLLFDPLMFFECLAVSVIVNVIAWLACLPISEKQVPHEPI